MKILRNLLLTCVVFCVTAATTNAQTPDCIKQFQFTLAGQLSTTIDNRGIGCTVWTVAYQSSGFSAISLVFQSATGASVAGTFGNYSGTTVSGANPSTNTTANVSQFAGYVGWARMTLASKTGTGTVTGVLYGYKKDAANVTATISGSVNSTITNTPLPVTNPVTPNLLLTEVSQPVAASLKTLPATSSTTTTPGPSAGLTPHCDYSVAINGSAAASTVVIAGVAANRIYVCGFTFTGGGTGTVKFTEATTATACATASADRTGAMNVILGQPVTFAPGDAFAFNTVTAGKDVCVVTTAAATAQGIMSFMVRP